MDLEVVVVDLGVFVGDLDVIVGDCFIDELDLVELRDDDDVFCCLMMLLAMVRMSLSREAY